jgi:hypothetical protein
MKATGVGTSSVSSRLSSSPPTSTIATASTGDSGPPEARSQFASFCPLLVRRRRASIRSSAAR